MSMSKCPKGIPQIILNRYKATSINIRIQNRVREGRMANPTINRLTSILNHLYKELGRKEHPNIPILRTKSRLYPRWILIDSSQLATKKALKYKPKKTGASISTYTTYKSQDTNHLNIYHRMEFIIRKGECRSHHTLQVLQYLRPMTHEKSREELATLCPLMLSMTISKFKGVCASSESVKKSPLLLVDSSLEVKSTSERNEACRPTLLSKTVFGIQYV